MEALDRVASDIANASTPGYKTERSSTEQADRPSFDMALKSAIDVRSGEARTDFRPGSLSPTSRELDVAIEGRGFLTLETADGPRYTRNGHLVRRADGVLASDAGEAVLGADGPITVGQGLIEIEQDGANCRATTRCCFAGCRSS
jgi:flagellar hook-basal body protein